MENKKKKKVSKSKIIEEYKEVQVVITYYENPLDSTFIPLQIPR
jgi:hypothetical protein